MLVFSFVDAAELVDGTFNRTQPLCGSVKDADKIQPKWFGHREREKREECDLHPAVKCHDLSP